MAPNAMDDPSNSVISSLRIQESDSERVTPDSKRDDELIPRATHRMGSRSCCLEKN